MLRVLILFVAVAAGGVAAWLALSMPASAPPVAIIAQAAPLVSAQEVLVASAELEQGQALRKESVRWESWPEKAINPAYITRLARPDAIEVLNGSIVRSRFVSGEPMRDEKLAPANSGFLSAMLPAGKRAVAVRVSAENTAGGFVLPNDRVDVLHTAPTGQGEGSKENISRTILKNIRVLAVDQTADESKAKAVVVGKTATLELDPQQAESLAAAQASGILSLALRSAADNGEAPSLITQQSVRTVQILRAGRSEIVKTQ